MTAHMSPQLKVFRTIWGAENQFSADIDVLFTELHRLGFDGIEASLLDIHRLSNNDDKVFMDVLTKNKLELIGICYTNWADFVPGSWQDLTVDEHLENLKRELEQMMKYNPIHINIHGGQDNWTLEQHERFFQEALLLQAKYPNISSSHEVCFFCLYILFDLIFFCFDIDSSWSFII
jgi:sugar phosphate isomerase/epimerase